MFSTTLNKYARLESAGHNNWRLYSAWRARLHRKCFGHTSDSRSNSAVSSKNLRNHSLWYCNLTAVFWRSMLRQAVWAISVFDAVLVGEFKSKGYLISCEEHAMTFRDDTRKASVTSLLSVCIAIDYVKPFSLNLPNCALEYPLESITRHLSSYHNKIHLCSPNCLR